MILTKLDNDIIIEHLYEWNKSAKVTDKLALDVYIKSIDFIEDDIVFYYKRISPIISEECGITKENVSQGKEEIGQYGYAKLSNFEEPYKNILLGAIREIKLKSIL